MVETAAWLTVIMVIFGIILAAAWIILPLALIGTKPLLRQLLAETKRTNELLERRLREGVPPVSASARVHAPRP
jgi:hypothetical protein